MHNDYHPTPAAQLKPCKGLQHHKSLHNTMPQQSSPALQHTTPSLATIQQVFHEERIQYNIAPAKIKNVKISYSQITVSFDDGSRLSAPLDAYPYSKQVSSKNLAKWEALRWQVWKHLSEMRHANVHHYRTKRPDAFSP